MSTPDGIGIEVKTIKSGTGRVLAIIESGLIHIKAFGSAQSGEFAGYSESASAWLLPLRLWEQAKSDNNIQQIVIHELDSGRVYEIDKLDIISGANQMTVVNNEQRILVKKAWATPTQRKLKVML